MRQVTNTLIVTLVIAIAGIASGTLLAQTTATETKLFEVVSVDGNKVVVKGENGAAQEITVPDDFRLTVDGTPVAVRDLRPGMKGVARITTTTTVIPVTVTEVRQGKVVKVVGNSIIVRTAEGNQMFSEADVSKRGVKINGRDGKPINFSDLREGYDLTATIVTEHPPRIMTQREVDAAMRSVPAGTTAAAAPQAAGAESVPGAAPAPARQLPKTAGPLPLILLAGTAALAVAGILRARRRRA